MPVSLALLAGLLGTSLDLRLYNIFMGEFERGQSLIQSQKRVPSLVIEPMRWAIDATIINRRKHSGAVI